MPARAYGRSLSDFEPLLPAERKLLEATARGEVAEISDERPEKAAQENIVRAGFLRFLLLGGDEQAPVHERGVKLQGAWISETLDLENSTAISAIDCSACTFEQPLILRQAEIPGLHLQGSSVPSIRGDRAVITGSVFLRENFKATGTVRFIGAEIGNNLKCNNSHMDGSGDSALRLDSAVIRGGVFLRDGFKATGAVIMTGANIGRDLACDKAEFNGNGGDSLDLDHIVVDGSLFLHKRFKAIGTVHLNGAKIRGTVDFSNAEFDGNGGDSILANGVVIKGDVFLTHGFKSIGEVCMPGAQIGGDFFCTNSEFYNDKGQSFSAVRAIVKGSLFLRDNFKSTGTISLIGMQIGGDLDCSEAHLDAQNSETLLARNMHVAGTFFFMNLPKPANKVWLNAASAGRLVDDAKAWGSNLVLDGFTYESIGGGAPTDATERLAWLDRQQDAMSGLSGSGADFRPQPWKQLQKVLREMGHSEDARQVAIALEDRLRKADLIGVAPPHWGWLRRTVYRWVTRGFHQGFRALTGYGYRPMRLMVWILGVWWGCAAFYWYAALSDEKVFAPSNPLVFLHPPYEVCAPDTPASLAELAKPSEQRTVVGAGNWYLCKTLRGEYTGFSPLAYSLDVLLPLVDLQQQKDWGPMIPTPQASWWREWGALSLGHWTRLVVWLQTLFGWLASLLLVAIVSGLTKRRED